MPGCKAAHRPGVRPHDAVDAAIRSTGLAVAVDDVVDSPRAPAITAAVAVLIRCLKDMRGLVGEDTVDVVGTPAIVCILHDETRPARAGVGEVPHRVLREETHIGPIRLEPRLDVLDVLRYASPVRRIPKVGHRRVAP